MKTLNGQSIVDIAIQTAGSIESAFDLAISKGLSVTDVLSPGTEINTENVINKTIVDYFTMKNLKPATDLTAKALIIAGVVGAFVSIPKNYKSVSTIKALVNQTILDLAIQECGSVIAGIDFALENGLSITDDLIIGTAYTKTSAINNKIALYFKQRNLLPATGLTIEETAGIFDITFDFTFN